MSTLFLIICCASVVFYAVFLIECSRPRRTSKKASAVHKLTAPEAVDFASVRRFLVHLEQQMAQFLSAHHRSATLLLIAMVLLSIPIGATNSPAATGI